MAPLPIFQESQIPVLSAAEVGYNFPPSSGSSIPRSRPVPVGGTGAPDVDDVFVVVVSLAVVAALLAFVLLQAIAALRELLEQRSSAFCALPISTFRKHGLASLNSTEAEHQRLLEETASIDSNGYRYSRWVGVHRCQFTLSPDRYDSDTSSTLTRSSSSSSDSTVVGGRICVVYDDTVETHSDDDDEEEEESEGEEDEDECEDGEGEDGDDSQCVPLRPVHAEPRPRVRRAAIFI